MSLSSILTDIFTPQERPDTFILRVAVGTTNPSKIRAAERALRNLMERSLLKSSPTAEWLPMDLAWLAASTGGSASTVTAVPTAAARVSIVPETAGDVPSVSATAVENPSVSAPLPAGRALTPIDAAEYQMIAEALRAEGGGIRRAATRLGLTHQALLRRLQKWPELRQIAQS